MSTQEQRRQQIGADNTNARRASGVAMRDDMRALAEPPKLRQPMPEVPKRGSAPTVRGVGGYSATSAQASGGGIESPLDEPDYSARTYYAENRFLSSSFLMSMEIKPLKSIAMVDAGNNPVVLQFAEPVE